MTTRPATPRLPALLLGALVGCALACAPKGEAAPVRHVVVVVIDATSARHLGCYGGDPATTPHLDALARRGLRFAHAFSNTTWTLPSTVSLFTGRRQEDHGVVTANHLVPEHELLLAGRLAAAGVATTGLSQMIFASPRHRVDLGFDSFHHAGPRDGEALEDLDRRAREWVTSRGDGPSFLYLHLRRPHSPYAPAPEHLRAVGCTCDEPADGRWRRLRFLDSQDTTDLDEAQRAHVTHLYRGNLHQVDARLGELLAALGTSLDRDTLVIVTSDHGEALGEHGVFGHGDGLWAEQLRIPLLMAGPGLEPEVVQDPVSTVDLLPTVLDALGLPRPPHLEGRSLLPGSGRSGPRPVLFSARRYPDATPAVGALGPTLKLVREADGTLRAFRWRGDPHEEHPIDPSLAPPEERQALLEALEELRRAPTTAVPPLQLDPTAREHLRELGYIR